MRRSPGSLEGMSILHIGPATLTSSFVLRSKSLCSFSKAAAHARFLNENSCWLRLLVLLVSLEMFFSRA